jgi:hypothetical protein
MSRKPGIPGARAPSPSRRRFVATAVGGLAAMALGRAGGASAQDEPALRALHEAAKQEGEMIWYNSL